MPLCGATTIDKYLSQSHRCGLPGTTHKAHHCKQRRKFGECGYGWIDGIVTHALEDWVAWGWRIDSDYKGPPIDSLERSTMEELTFGKRQVSPQTK